MLPTLAAEIATGLAIGAFVQCLIVHIYDREHGLGGGKRCDGGHFRTYADFIGQAGSGLAIQKPLNGQWQKPMICIRIFLLPMLLKC